MKKILALLLIVFFAPIYAQANTLIIPADDDGIVTVPRTQSSDLKEHSLVSIESDSAAAITSKMGVTTFSALNYNNGIFDTMSKNLYSVKYEGFDFGKITDNNASTYTTFGQNAIFIIEFTKAINFSAIHSNVTNSIVTYNFYLEDKHVHRLTGSLANYHPLLVKADKIVITSIDNETFYELDFFGDLDIDYIAVSNLVINNIKENSANVSYKLPNTKYLTSVSVLLDGKVVYEGQSESVVLPNLESDKTYEVIARAHYSDGNHIDTKVNFKTAKDKNPPGKVVNLTAKQVANTVVLNWTAPTDKDLSHYRITRNGILLTNDLKAITYIDTSPKLNTDNVYRVLAADEAGNFSSGASVTITVVGTEVFNVQAKAASHDKVDLSWKNPQRDDFETVRIARKNQDSGIVKKILNFFSSNDGYTDLFQTNGTIFNDLTVNADTQYTYRLRTVLSGDESPGVTVNVKTPKVTASGGGVEVDPNNKDYTITWTSPTTGKMKILVGGKEYKTVPAADKKIVIPAADMKFDLIGKPDVKLVPVSDDGKEGIPSSPGGGGTSGGGGLGDIVGGGAVNAVLNANNLLKAGVALLGAIGGFVLLGLAFRVVPKLIRTIRTAYAARGGIN